MDLCQVFKVKVCGWQEASIEEYAKCYETFGGSVIIHPRFLEFIHGLSNCQPRYFVKYKNNSELIAGICTWAGEDNKRTLAWEGANVERPPVGYNYDEVILPISAIEKIVLPYKTKLLSSLNKQSVRNVTYKINSNRVICLAKHIGEGGFSSKTKNSRERDVRKFLDAGGEIKKVSDFSAEEMSKIYDKLFRIRRGYSTNFPMLSEGIKHLPEFYFGNVLFINDEPCAYQLILMAESPKWISFDFVNIVVDTSMPKLSIGTVIMWLNIKDALSLCESKNKEMRFSFGKNTGEYKSRWCYQEPLGRVIA